MRTVLLVLATILLQAGCAAGQQASDAFQNNEPFREYVQAFVTNYIELKNALVNENPVQVAKEASEFQTYLMEVDGSALKAEAGQEWVDAKLEMLNLLEEQADRIELASQRRAFKSLSDNVEYVVERFGPISRTLFKQFCPTAFGGEGAYWLNEKRAILNPYGGRDHLRCGKVVEVFEGIPPQPNSSDR